MLNSILIRGESKEVVRIGQGLVEIRFLPTVYSFSANRSGVIPGTAEIRVRSSQILTGILAKAGISHAYESFSADRVIAREVVPPPIEVVVKGRHVGTPKHRYYGLSDWPTRTGKSIGVGERYSSPHVRFDWRNPQKHPETGERLADEVLHEDLADEFINVRKARITAFRCWTALSSALDKVGIELVDICLFIDVTGEIVFGELSPDCSRFRYEGKELDKDVWRQGKTAELVLKRWREFVCRIEVL